MKVRRRVSKRGNTVWEVINSRGKVLKSFTGEVDFRKYINKKLYKLENWPPPAKELETEEDWDRAEKIASRRNSWESWNFAVAKWRGLLQTDELVAHLGVSESWVRKNLRYTEWHHSYKQKGRNGNAFFYDPEHVMLQLMSDEKLQERLLKLSFKKYTELCALIDRKPALTNLGWYSELLKRKGEEN